MTTKGKWLALEKKLHEITLDLPWSRWKRFHEVFPPIIYTYVYVYICMYFSIGNSIISSAITDKQARVSF